VGLRAHTSPPTAAPRVVSRRAGGPALPAAERIRALQRSAGNRATAAAVGRTLARCGAGGCTCGGACGGGAAKGRPEDELLEALHGH
jgi:hypothetical protein